MKSIMMHRIMNRVMIALWVCAFPAWASFDVMEDDWDESQYGYAQTRPFRQALEGNGVLTPRDRSFLTGLQETRITDRSYVRLLVGDPKVRLDSLNSNRYAIALALGTVSERWGFEGEVFVPKGMRETGIVFPDGTVADRNVRIYSAFFNVYYIFSQWFEWQPSAFQPYLAAGIGAAYKSVDWSNVVGFALEGNTSTHSAKVKDLLSWLLAVGFRYQVTPCVLFDCQYRLMHLGKVRWIRKAQIIPASSLRAGGLFVGLSYQF